MKRITRRAGFGLVEILVVIVLIAVLSLILLPRLTGGRDAAGRKVPAPRERARQAQGVSYTQQINMAIQMYRDDNEGRNPPRLADLKAYKVTDEMIQNPVTHQPLSYDPETGVVGGAKPVLPRVNGF